MDRLLTVSYSTPSVGVSLGLGVGVGFTVACFVVNDSVSEIDCVEPLLLALTCQ